MIKEIEEKFGKYNECENEEERWSYLMAVMRSFGDILLPLVENESQQFQEKYSDFLYKIWLLEYKNKQKQRRKNGQTKGK